MLIGNTRCIDAVNLIDILAKMLMLTDQFTAAQIIPTIQ